MTTKRTRRAGPEEYQDAAAGPLFSGQPDRYPPPKAEPKPKPPRVPWMPRHAAIERDPAGKPTRIVFATAQEEAEARRADSLAGNGPAGSPAARAGQPLGSQPSAASVDPASSQVAYRASQGAPNRTEARVVAAMDAAAAKAEAAEPGWRSAALAAIRQHAETHETLVASEVRLACGTPEGSDGRAWGALMREAQALGWIRPGEPERDAWGSWKTRWRSLVYRGGRETA